MSAVRPTGSDKGRMATHDSFQDRFASHKILVLLVSLELCFEPASARREAEMAAATVDPTRVSTPVSRARAGRKQAHSWSLLRWKSFAPDMVSHARSRGLASSAERIEHGRVGRGGFAAEAKAEARGPSIAAPGWRGLGVVERFERIDRL